MTIDPTVALHTRPLTHTALHAWVRAFTGIDVPRQSICPGHNAPFEYLARSFFEPAGDLVVWAPRGGGKTRLAAVATLLDLIHKPPCSVRILGGSLAQSLRMWEHLLPEVHKLIPDLLVSRSATHRRIDLTSGANAAVLTQSERAVRGLRVQKLRCDEVELFKPHIWQAAQLVTRSIDASETPHTTARQPLRIGGTVEAISTLHSPFGLMQQIIEQAQTTGVPILRWCLLEVLEKCPPQRACDSCPLWDECRGVAKTRCNGFVSIDDAIAMKRRVSREAWDAEVLCRRPSLRGCVFSSFDPSLHVRELLPETHRGSSTSLWLAIDFGYANPFVCLWIRALEREVHVIDEYVQAQQTVAEHLRQITGRNWGTIARVACDPAGGSVNEQTARSNVQLLRDAGYPVRCRSSRIVDGIEMIRTALAPASGPARLFVHPRCTRLIRALRSYRYANNRSELPLKDGVHDHLIDALRYFFINHATRGALARTY
jgi:hypothetical protein